MCHPFVIWAINNNPENNEVAQMIVWRGEVYIDTAHIDVLKDEAELCNMLVSGMKVGMTG